MCRCQAPGRGSGGPGGQAGDDLGQDRGVRVDRGQDGDGGPRGRQCAGRPVGAAAAHAGPMTSPSRRRRFGGQARNVETVMRKLGFVDYWRAKGWPPQCHPIAGDDFVCE